MKKLPRIALLCVGMSSCSWEKHVTITQEMSWQCDYTGPGPQPPSGVELLTLRYVADPSYYDVASGRGVCDELRASGKPTAAVVYDVWGAPGRLRGYNIQQINGKPFHELDPGVAHSGQQAVSGRQSRHPLEAALR